MAEFLWTFAVQEVLKKVVKVAAEEIGVTWGFKKELSKLTKWLHKSEAILRDINTKKLHHDSVRMWVDDLQQLVYEADDLLDELVYERLRRSVETEKTKNKVHNFFSSSHNPFLFRRNMAKRMKNITETLFKHYCEASPLGLVALVGAEESTETHKNIDLKQIRDTTSNLNHEQVIIGREVEVSNIVKLVIDSSNEHSMFIIPIVGMGGLGKTTLAKMIFNHELVKAHFNETIWVCVSEPFIVLNILEGIFQSFTKTSSSGLNKENLLRRLQGEMRGKNYFLVLDDVWNEEARLWDELRECLKNITGKSGNTVIVTTRSVDVGTIMGTTSNHYLKNLCDDECWSLFKESANASSLEELEMIREEVVRKIGGVPLVAKVLGGAVKFEGDYKRWVTKFKSVMKNISKDDKDFVSSILKLSVDCLPLLSLKQCFAYCSNFPKDYIFEKTRLVRMWIAQGFIQPQDEDCNGLTMEDIGEGYFNFLLSRSLFEVVDKYHKCDRIITYFKMHDLIHDIACAISNHQKVESDLSEKSVRKLRTLICFDENIDTKFEDYASLRVLALDARYLEPFHSFGMLKHLRYLHIYGHIAELKVDLESITMLYNLQSLKLGGNMLPRIKDLRKLVNLRHLEFDDVGYGEMPLHISQLIHLQTLSAYRVSVSEGGRIEELGPLKNLKGSLQLAKLENVRSKEEALGAKLMEKKNITELTYNYSCVYSNDEEADHNNQNGFLEEVLEELQPHHNVQSLSICEYPGQVVPNRIFVEGLVMIALGGCRKCEKIPMFGQLPNLEELIIVCMDSLKSIGREFYGSNDSNNQRVSFPKLKKFSLSYTTLENWENVPNGIAFPHLELLAICYCPKLMSFPDHFASLQVLRIENCEELTNSLPNQSLQSCNSIKTLKISDCPNLDLKMCNQYNNLECVSIGGCMKDCDFSPFIHQSSITHLSLMDTSQNDATIQLPQQLGYLTTLKKLKISHFNGIEALPEWLENLAGLEELKLSFCANLKWLPSKQVMLSLTKLNRLEVKGCLQLRLGQGDPQRAKLSHLPNNCIKIY